MRFRRLILFLAALALVSAAATATALASRTDSSPIQGAVTKASKASSVKFEFTLAVTTSGSTIPGGKLSLSGSGTVDSRHKSADLRVDLGSLAPLLSAVTKGAPVPKSVEVVVVNNVVYVNFPALAKQLGAPGKSWVKLDLGKLPKSTTGGINPKAVQGISPQQALTVLRSSLSVHKVGSDQYGTHYHGSLKLTSLVVLVPKAQQASMRTSLAKAGIHAIPFDVWVGHGGYVTRLTVTVGVKASASQPAAKIGLTLNLHDYGHHVHVSAPPASQTVDGSALLSSLSGITGGG